MSPRKPTSERREDIVRATLALLAEAPPGEVSTRDVAARVGISQPAIFKHFCCRDSLFAAVVDHVRGELGREAERALATEAPLEGLLGACEALFRYAAEHPGLPRLLVFDVTSGGEADFHGHLRELVLLQRSAFTMLLGRAKERGELPEALDQERAAGTLVALIQGTLLSWLHAGRTGAALDLARPGLEQWLCAVRAGIPRRADEGTLARCEAAPKVPAVVHAPRGSRRPLRRLDVRPLLAAGTDPLSAILEALAQTERPGLLEVVAPFEPRPLLRLLAERGAECTVTRLGDACFRVWIRQDPATPLLDLTDLPAPEPLEAVLEAAAALAPGQALLAVLPQFPRLLVPHLEERGLEFALGDSEGGAALLFARAPSV